MDAPAAEVALKNYRQWRRHERIIGALATLAVIGLLVAAYFGLYELTQEL